MNLNKHFLYAAGLLLLGVVLSACVEDPGKGSTDQNDPELAAACKYIQGGGASATGGAGGTIYYVTSLSDDIDPESGKALDGTLRYVLEKGEARTILFSVAGTIHLRKPLEITKGNLTIAGQSAPGDGICIADYPLVIKSCNNVIVRFLRVRLGAQGSKASGEDYDAISVNNCSNVVLDHISASWSTDECVSCYGNKNFTCQYCFITESLRASTHVKGNHGYGGIWGGTNASFHHNLLAHHDSRNPRFDHDYVDTSCKGPIDFVNNVVYNWGGNSCYGGEGTSTKGDPRQINFVKNYYKPGPASSRREQLVNPTTKCGNCTDHCGGSVVPARFWMEGNYMYGSDAVTSDNWLGVKPDDASKLDMCKATSRVHFADIAEQQAEEAFQTVLAKAGCSLSRDALDARIADEVRGGKATSVGSNGSKNGLIDDPKDVGGWPELKGSPATDIDGDGIADAWEEAHGLNPRSYKDGKEQSLVSGISNLDVYLCDIVKHLY